MKEPNEIEPTGAATVAKRIEIVDGEAKLADLRPHAENINIYGERDSVADLVKSIKESGTGILEPLLITPSGEIIGGHRRYRAAQQLQLDEVPVRIFDSTDELEILNALLEHNRHRIKSKVQIANEATLRTRIKKEMREREKQNGAGQVAKLPPNGKTRDEIGKELGISGRTVDKAVKTTDAIAKMRTEGKEEDAEEVEAALKKGFDAGHKLAVKKGAIPAPKPKKKAAAKKGEAGKKANQEAPQTDAHPQNDTTSEKLSDSSPVKPATPSAGALSSEDALTYADHVITFLRSESAKSMKDQHRRDWAKVLDQIAACRKTLSL